MSEQENLVCPKCGAEASQITSRLIGSPDRKVVVEFRCGNKTYNGRLYNHMITERCLNRFLTAEVARLTARVAELEAENAKLKEKIDDLEAIMKDNW